MGINNDWSGAEKWALAESERLNRLEHSQNQMVGDITALKVGQQNTERAISAVDESVKSLAALLRDGNKPQYQVWVGFATFLFLLAAAFGSGYVSDQNENTSAIKELTASYHDHTLLEGHLGTTIRVQELTDKVAELDIILQREMRLLDSKMQSELDGLDEMLQREVRLLDGRIEIQTESNSKEISKLRDQFVNIKEKLDMLNGITK